MARSLSCLAALLFVAGGVGCAEAPASGPTGYLTVPLVAPGAGGVTYRLPPDSVLVLERAGNIEAFGIGGDERSQTVEVASGDYNVSLIDNAGDTTVWPLTKLNPDGTTETVQGVIDLAPTLTVVEHQTTSLVIRFHVAAIGAISFDVGAIDVSVEVDETAATGFDVTITAPSLTAGFVLVGAHAPSALPPRLPALFATGDGYSVTAHTTGPWSIVTSNFICAPVTVSVSATGNPGWVNLVAEAPPADVTSLCIQQAGPQQAFVFMAFFRTGGPTTPLLADLGDRQYFFEQDVSAQIAADLFDGFTLDLRRLSGPHPASLFVFATIATPRVDPPNTAFDTWYQVDESGNATVSLIGH